jgi:hypothetical protein
MDSLHIQRLGAVLVRLLVTVGVVLLVGALMALPALVRDAGAASQAVASSPLPRGPLSGGVLVAQAIHAGKLQPTSHGTGITPLPQLPTCSPTPCAIPNVQASVGKKPVNEDPIAANPANAQELLTGGNDYNCSSLLGFFASSDGDSTWNHTCMNTPATDPFGCGDPGVGYDLSGAAFITGIASPNSSCFPGMIILEKSTDNGKKWSAPAVAVPPLFSGGLTDKPWLQVDDTPSSPHASALYLSVTQFDASGSDSEISVSHSTNGGTSWTTTPVDTLQVFPAIDQFSDLAIGKDGTVLVSWMRCTANGAVGDCGGTQATLVLSKSTDGGSTWSKPVTIATVTLAPDPGRCCFYGQLPNTGERVSESAVLGIDTSSGSHAGNLYAAFYTWTGSFMVVDVATSTNGGSTWGTPVRVTPPGDPNDEFFPWLSVSSSGLVGVTWLDRRDDPANLSYEAFAAISSDGGATFPNLLIAQASSNPKNDGFKGTFMGDYTGNVWNSTGTILYASWMDSRNGTNMQDEVGGRIGAGSVPAWNIIASPTVGTISQLNGVAAVSASDVWAVGFSTPSGSARQTLTEHWNGTSWSVVSSPNVGTLGSNLNAVAVVSATDIWAVGWSFATFTGIHQTLIEQWNGTSWKVVSSPNVGTSGSTLNAVAVVSANDIWAVGSFTTSSLIGQTLVEHWNGTSWSVVSSPNVGTSSNVLNGVAVVSATDIWAVGSSSSCGTTSCVTHTLTEHWNGTSWSVVSSPNVDPSSNVLNGVAVVSANDIWAVGSSGGITNSPQTLIEQWNGTNWSVVSSPNVGTSGGSLNGVAVVSATDVWAVGQDGSGQTLTEQWNGTSWQVVKTLAFATTGNSLLGVAEITATNLWAVGIEVTSSSGAFTSAPLIEQFCC